MQAKYIALPSGLKIKSRPIKQRYTVDEIKMQHKYNSLDRTHTYVRKSRFPRGQMSINGSMFGDYILGERVNTIEALGVWDTSRSPEKSNHHISTHRTCK